MRQDVHIKYPTGGKTDFRGNPGTYYTLFSAPNLTMNMVVSLSDFYLHGALIHGTFMTQAHIVHRTQEGFFNLSFWADNVGPNHYSYSMINGTCAGKYVALGPKGKRVCGNVVAWVDYSTLHVVSETVDAHISVRPVYDRVKGPLHRLDIGASILRMPKRLHGLLGQGYVGPVRNGKVDIYPKSGEYTTSAWGEGAIDGVAYDYEVPDKWDTRFRYSCFDDLVYNAEELVLNGTATSD